MGPRNHVLDEVQVPHGMGQLLRVAWPTEKYWESAVVYAAKGIIQSSITACII